MTKKYFGGRIGVAVGMMAFTVLGAFLMSPIPVVRAANLYAQYADDTSLGGSGTGAMDGQYAVGSGEVQHVQVELNIANDEQRGTSYYCPVAPNTGVLVFIFQGGGYVYVHCVTSAEAAGKLGRKAVYTFDDAHFGYGGGDGWWANFVSQGSFNADVYGVRNAAGDFYPYLVLADGDGPGSPATISSLAQYTADAYTTGVTTTIPENGVADGSAVTFVGVPQSFFASDTVAFQVESEPYDVPLTGVPTAVSEEGFSGATSSVTVDGLAPGAYHWAGRAVDVTQGYESAWMEYRIAGNIDFSIPTSSAREPVVVVPGALGSRLVRADDGTEVWPDAQEMINSPSDQYLDYLKMNGDGTPAASRSVVATDILREATATFLGITFDGVFYKNLMDRLAEDGYEEGKDLFVVPYDWRLGAESSSAVLAGVVSSAVVASPTGKVDIIAHSMGGLLVKQYLSGIADTSFVDKVVLLGVPQLGAPKAWKFLSYGDDLGLNWFGIGLNRDEVGDIAENMPAAYELLPSERYLNIAGGYVQDFRNGGGAPLDYAATPVPNTALLAAADAFHGGLNGNGLDEQPMNAPSVYNIVGCGQPTITGFELYDGGAADVRRSAGDGTVPEVSAMDHADVFHNYFVLGGMTGIDHAGLVKDPRSLTLVSDILATDDSGAVPDSLLPVGISTVLPDCVGGDAGAALADETTIEFSSHGPVTLGVYDSAGRHTGITASGGVETNIPDSEYDVIGENSFVVVPAAAAGDVYRVVGAANASGTFDMKIKEYAGGTVDHLATFLSVPLEGASATVALNFAGFTEDMVLVVDSDGGGAANEIIAPSAVLVGPSSTNDVMPPNLILPQIPTEVMLGSTTTLVFSATDLGSGIAAVNATLNGIPVADGEVVSFHETGRNTFRLAATDRAGNPRIGEINFSVLVPPDPPAATSSAALMAVADTYLSLRQPTGDHGSDLVLHIGGEEDDVTLVGFKRQDLISAIGTSTILSARLILAASGTTAADRGNGASLVGVAAPAFSLSPIAFDWIENGTVRDCMNEIGDRNCEQRARFVPPLQRATRGGGVSAAEDASGISFDVTADVRSVMDGSVADDRWRGWAVSMEGKPPFPLAEFYSRETDYGPQLVVTYKKGQ